MLDNEYLTEPELAAELGRSPRTMKRWRARRIGPPVTKIGNRIMYRRDAVRQWLLDLERGQPREGRAA